jgi:hypothetical protein
MDLDYLYTRLDIGGLVVVVDSFKKATVTR